MERKISLLVVIVVVLFIPFSGFCLDTTVGVKAGVGFFSYLGEDYGDFLDTYNLTNDRKLGFAGGVSVTLEFTDVFALQPEILIVGAGDAYRENASVYDALLWGPYSEWVLTIDQLLYATLPVLVKVRF